MRFLKAIAVASFLISINLSAQVEFRNKEVSITNENDVYLLMNFDKYYSNGVFLNYRWSPRGDSTKGGVKRVYTLGLSHRFWTPQDVTITRSQFYYRPYAGMLNVSYRDASFYGENSRLMYGVDAGVTGKPSGAQAFQEGYHNLFGFPDPEGWDTQISTGFVADFKLEFNYQFQLIPSEIDLVTSTSGSLGNAFTNLRQRVDLRFGNLKSLRHSSFFNALIGEGSDAIEKHSYFFAGYGIEAVGHNVTIEGHVFDDDSPITEEIVPWVRHLRLGFVTNTQHSTFRVLYNWLSREVKTRAGRHSYISFQLDLRLPFKGVTP
ncbi:MAG: lipid A deacylase LpxR family protein [Roseivirga sp.]|uniref:lipid A deacylase LpxR family protein n=1 Tax=Roseivirga sp. TaxID=1964215 RepID=UPI001B1CB5AE|nr:lipid A deacylase LpxR family protein [Roseivirga sp.]MBO6662047.1 lipid A deacylase LpxR family protein [Roseivirga sp.]MBO6761172.1 lipid A deacylase LpxR family protein [Roseivirga sp.]MBO6909364.1 lipid A deacylase LpxR family protein [Roseivirga sp.]